MANIKITLLLLAWLFGTVNSTLLALDPQKYITQYIHKKCTSDDGLPGNNISDILQTSDGYLWIGTGGGGINRLKDEHIIIYTPKNGLSSNSVFSIIEDRDRPGTLLDRVIAQKAPLSPGESLDIILQLLDALVEIHRSGIIHRDLKPPNIMLVKKGNKENFVKILDFGLARTQSVSRVTESGMVVGTLNYLAPEQLLDSRYSSASDIYALGVIFYEMLTGEKPYKGATPLEMMQAIFKTNAKEPKTLNKDIPDKLNGILMDMIDKKPDNRPSAEVLQITLQKLFNASGGQEGSFRENHPPGPPAKAFH